MITARYKKYIILIIPLLYLGWNLLLNHLTGPFSTTRSDPEYPYLLNGLACATLDFNNIGHTDHPGTPMQIITGICIRITHALIGQGPVVQDVLSRPEVYLSAASVIISLLTFLLILWIGRLVIRRNGDLTGALILQSSLLLSSVLIEIPLRYNPDRLLTLYNLILAGITYKYLFSKSYSARRYAIIAGILMGVGFATKFNFLPVLIIPLLLTTGLKNKLIYSGTVIASFFICLIPILNKFQEFRRFISGIVSHDGLYGHGTEQMINWKSFGHNLIDLLYYNPAYSVILLISIITIIYFLPNRNKRLVDKRLIIAIQAFVLASLVGFILVSKHFKIYYFAPVLSFSGLIFFLIWTIAGVKITNEKIRKISGISLLLVFVFISGMNLPSLYRAKLVQREAHLKTSHFYSDNISRNDILFVEPTWEAGPFVENALVYGISYVAHRHEYYRDFCQLYPNVITWEGSDVRPKLFRTIEADPESILFSGKDIFVYSSPGRNAGQLLDYIDTLAIKSGVTFSRDTVFTNPAIPGLTNEEYVIRSRNADGWSTLKSMTEFSSPVELDNRKPVSQELRLSDVRAGDYLEITLCILHNDTDDRCRIIARSNQPDQDGVYLEDSRSLQDIGNGWQLLRLRGRITASPADGLINCLAYYPGSKKLTIQDMRIRHLGIR